MVWPVFFAFLVLFHVRCQLGSCFVILSRYCFRFLSKDPLITTDFGWNVRRLRGENLCRHVVVLNPGSSIFWRERANLTRISVTPYFGVFGVFTSKKPISLFFSTLLEAVAGAAAVATTPGEEELKCPSSSFSAFQFLSHSTRLVIKRTSVRQAYQC